MIVSEIEGRSRKIFEEAGFNREPVHGLRHFEQVQKEYQKLCSLVPLESKVSFLLKIAIDAHDIGRVLPGEHAANSAQMFGGWPIKDLSSTDKDTVIFAVANHGRGLVGLGIKKAETLAQKILGLLVICDHMDAASPEGAARAAIAYKGKPTIGSLSKRDLLWAMGKTLPFEERGRYTTSLLGNWVWDYSATGPIIQAIDLLVTTEYKQYVEDRLLAFRSLIDLLLEISFG